MLWLVLLLIALSLVLYGFFHYRARFAIRDDSIAWFSDRKTLLVTAHPDDECLFYGPFLLQQKSPNMYMCCLSSGDYCQDERQKRQQGITRTREFHQSCRLLLSHHSSMQKALDDRCWVMDDAELKDGPWLWKEEAVIRAIAPLIQQHGIQTIVTFDAGGVSGHPNHISIPRALRWYYLHHNDLDYRKLPKLPADLHVFELETVPWWRKYVGIGDLIWVAMWDLVDWLYIRLGWSSEEKPELSKGAIGTKKEEKGKDGLRQRRKQQPERSTDSDMPPRRVRFIASPYQYWIGMHAMRQHQSQLVWFRWLYLLFSRYMLINELYLIPTIQQTNKSFGF